MFEESDLIHRYTRAQAIADGVLVDVSEAATAIGVIYPTAVTRTVWSQYVKSPERADPQEETARLWELLWTMRLAISRAQDTDTVLFDFFVHANDSKNEKIVLKAVCGPDDDGSPCVTVMMPGED